MIESLARVKQQFSRWSFSAFAVLAVSLVFGPAVFAEFGRTTGPVGWGYGYGYGWSYGDGWDSGTQAGYRTTFLAPETGNLRDYGYGFGRMLPAHDDAESISYDADTDTYHIDAADLGDIFEAGLAIPVESSSLENASAFLMEANVRVHSGDSSVLFHRGDEAYFDDSYDVRRLSMSSDFPVDGIQAIRGQMRVGPALNIEMPFSFEFYGEEKTHFRVSSNGFITFTVGDDNGCCDGQAMPDDEDPNDVVAGTWMDLVPYGDASYSYEVFGEAPNRVMVVEFLDVPEYDEDAGMVTFQIHLHENDGTVEIHTGLLDVRDHRVTQGIENSGGTRGTTVLDVESSGEDGEDDYLATDFAYRFTPGSPNYSAESIAYDPYEMTEEATDVTPPDDDSFFPEEDVMYFDSGEAEVSIAVESRFNGARLSIAQRDYMSDDWDRYFDRCTVADGFCTFNATDFGYYVVHGGTSTSGSGSGGGSGGGSGSVAPAVVLTYPVGGETFTGGSTKTISWTANEGIDHSRVSYSTDSGIIWTTIAEEVIGTSRSWSVPNINTSHARVRVEGMNAAGGVISISSSSVDFSIRMSEDSDDSDDDGSEDERHGVTGAGSKGREEANRILPPGFPVDSLVKLADDRDSSTDADTTVYYIGLDAKRHPFPTGAIYRSWYQDFSEVRPIDGATLASIPLGAPILVRPGTHWVKITSDPKTYFVEPGYSLRWIQDETAARVLGGPDWMRNVIDLDVSLFSVFSTGPDITTASLATDWPAGSLVSTTGGPTDTYYVTTDGRRSFMSAAAMQANHFQTRFVTRTADDAGWVSKAIGAIITGFEEALFSLMH